MSVNREIFEAAAALEARGEPYILITVISARGSTPREAGARMLWHENGSAGGEAGRWIGTIGGGQFERLVLDDARRYLEAGVCGAEHYVLAADADQCCGGVMDVFFEPCAPAARIIIFGAGHVACELARLLQSAPVQTVIVDDRPEWNSPERFPRAQRILSYPEGLALASQEPHRTLACIMTCSHDTDFDLLRELLKSPPAFVGLIGSRSKRACLLGRLVASGVHEDVVQQVRCPIGVGDTGKAPPLVAISIAAQLLLEVRKHAGQPR